MVGNALFRLCTLFLLRLRVAGLDKLVFERTQRLRQSVRSLTNTRRVITHLHGIRHQFLD